MLRLAAAAPFASGDFRDCYPHPDDPALCVKLVRRMPADHHLGRFDRLLGRRVADPNLREYLEYREHVAKGVPLDRYFPAVHGFVETDLGRGLCLDLLTGDDGRQPVSLRDYLLGHARPADLDPAFVLREVAEFARFCRRHAILASCDEPQNMGFLRAADGWRLVAFDLKLRQNKEMIPIATIFPFFRRRKIARRFGRTMEELRRALAERPESLPVE